MRTFECSLISFVLLSTVPALAADSPSEQESVEPPRMPLGGADPRGPGPLTVPPAEVHLPVTGQSTTDDFTFDYHGYFRAPLTLSLGTRANPGPDQGKTTFHTPFNGTNAAIPDARPGTWLYDNTVAPGWASALFSYGNKTVTGTVGFLAYQFTAAQDAGQSDNNSAVSLGPVFLDFQRPGGGREQDQSGLGRGRFRQPLWFCRQVRLRRLWHVPLWCHRRDRRNSGAHHGVVAVYRAPRARSRW